MVAPLRSDNAVISVVIPSYNRKNFLRKALESVLDQTLQAHEILVVDDGSNDHTITDLSSDFPTVTWLRQENAGVSAARNHGIRKASGEWIALLDSDDQWHKEKLEAQLRLLSTEPNSRACHTEEKWIRNQNQVNPPNYLDKSPRQLFKRSLRHCLICSSSCILHRSLFDEIGLFDESLPVCEDYDFWLRLLLHTSIKWVDQPLTLKFGGHADQLSTTHWGMDRYRIQAMEKVLASEKISEEQTQWVLETLVQKCQVLEQGFAKRNKLNEARLYSNKRREFEKGLKPLQPTGLP
ncbi:MAG TPA: glycosyl transferase [Opitutae bacterium]|mgnify:FL=1|nr:glycosyl transferase [Opitutae bacterium]HBJ60942.1 glycosyl transferase [Opitutae bacterium]|tara:strand:+ start:1962 stop:2843 length:882 start_codon:yes stop_codon:yes gene_type:complete